MKNKLKELKKKLVETLCTFLGSFLALFAYYFLSEPIQNFLLKVGIPKNFSSFIMSTIFSLFVALGFLLFYACFLLLSTVTWFKRPTVSITFYNDKKCEIKKLNFKKNPEEPKFLKMKFETKLNWLQTKVIQVLKPMIVINSNPPMCAFAFDDGFPYEVENYKIEGKTIYCDILKLFSVSEKPVSVNMDFNAQLITCATGTIKVTCVPQIKNSILKGLMRTYFKCEAELEIKGD